MFNFGDLGNMMKMLKDLQENVKKAKEELKKEEIEVEVGGGMLKIVENGLGEVIDIQIDKSLLNEENEEVLKDLLIAALNEANARAKEVMSKKMTEASGLPANLPGMDNLF
ncbi:YbaB/EbfC family nucleoid-associated protein [Hydrogenothermus marinus]|uniref:Nucleoid-associated protein CLV39_0318 n=1 Tax=Hydrogenothermus marinus TaxID=133270 RepID=A0A3M0BT52_9AQUI|nr:YbaB/EbfC family nucleoid-associated protein [Hydrogenothermus marinus]RMA97695.1 hypothetical protein CLV39_0318 [Hydrogenothermus marinus]